MKKEMKPGRISPEQVAAWIKEYGYDSDFVRIKIRGEFPKPDQRKCRKK